MYNLGKFVFDGKDNSLLICGMTKWDVDKDFNPITLMLNGHYAARIYLSCDDIQNLSSDHAMYVEPLLYIDYNDNSVEINMSMGYFDAMIELSYGCDMASKSGLCAIRVNLEDFNVKLIK